MGLDFAFFFESYFKAAAAGRLSSAYIFCGGAVHLRRERVKFLAKLLNCQAENKPCDTCRVCYAIEQGEYENLLFVESKNTISIEKIRQAQKFSYLKSFSSGVKVVVIDNAQNLSPEAANAFLKILEEPPAGVVFILLAQDLRYILPTIKSRCQIIRLRVSEEEIKNYFAKNLNIPFPQAKALAALSGGDVEKAKKIQNYYYWKKREEIFKKKGDFFLKNTNLGQKREEVSFMVLSLLYFLRDALLVQFGAKEDKIASADLKDYVYDYARAHAAADLLDKLKLSLEIYNELDNLNLNVAKNLAGGIL